MSGLFIKLLFILFREKGYKLLNFLNIMVLKVYNTLTRKKEVFKPIHSGNVGMYCCGPTVYNYAHIGNLRTYIFEDILKRVLLFDGFKVKHVMNITDVGHLTSDADTGEDKMLKGAKREGKSVWDIAKFYEKAFFDDIKSLNILKPDIKCRATDHINNMINLIKRIEKNGFTYEAGGNVYFDVSKFKDYGKLAKLNMRNLEAGSRVEVDINKKSPYDFVLWFTKSKFDNQEMKWDSPWGVGYPGWHIECSAMSIRYLGEHFDIHCGGVDHIPVHHTNEIAQSEAATGEKWVNYWVHGEFLVLEKERMAKSGENFLILKTLFDKGYSALDYRYFCLTAHYRKQLMFSYDALDSARNSFFRLKNLVLEFKKSKEKIDDKVCKKYLEEFSNVVNDDLNVPKGLAILWEVVKADINDSTKYKILLDFDSVLGLGLDNLKEEKIPSSVLKLVAEREKARANKDWKESDRLRDEISRLGYSVKDTKDGSVLVKN